MAKPSTVFSWATDANYPAGSEAFSGTPTKVAPVSGLIAQGWAPKQKPTAQALNYNLNLIGEWIAYVAAGAFDGPITVTGDLTITDDLIVEDTAHINSILEVDGAVILNSTMTVGDDATFDEDVTVTGEIIRPDRRRSYGPKMDGHDGAGTGAYGLSSGLVETWTLDTSGGRAFKNLNEFIPGDRIKAVRLTYASPGGAPDLFVTTARPNINSTLPNFDIGTPVSVGGGLSVAEYTVPSGYDDDLTLKGVTMSGGLSPGFAERASIVIEATSNDTVIYSFEVRYDHTSIPADIP